MCEVCGHFTAAAAADDDDDDDDDDCYCPAAGLATVSHSVYISL